MDRLYLSRTDQPSTSSLDGSLELTAKVAEALSLSNKEQEISCNNVNLIAKVNETLNHYTADEWRYKLLNDFANAHLGDRKHLYETSLAENIALNDFIRTVKSAQSLVDMKEVEFLVRQRLVAEFTNRLSELKGSQLSPAELGEIKSIFD